MWSAEMFSNGVALKTGSRDQPILRSRGDYIRIDWGYLYVAAANNQKPEAVQANAAAVRHAFVAAGKVSGVAAPLESQRPASIAPVSAIAFQFGSVGAKPVSRDRRNSTLCSTSWPTMVPSPKARISWTSKVSN